MRLASFDWLAWVEKVEWFLHRLDRLERIDEFGLVGTGFHGLDKPWIGQDLA